MSDQLLLLCATAASIGFLHTLIGPDHYLPFVVLARARGWSLGRTTLLTLGCGVGHVLSSVVLGFVGIGLGVAVSRLEAVESYRGGLAAWLLIAVGVVYAAWGLRRALRSHGHRHHLATLAPELHEHDHRTGRVHDHQHTPGDAHHHDHAHGGRLAAAFHPPAGAAGRRLALTPWVLFLVFVLGPCEPLIPLLMVPAAAGSPWDVAIVTAVFGAVTLATMLAAVLVGLLGVSLVSLGRLERFSHAIAGVTIALSGLGIQLLGL